MNRFEALELIPILQAFVEGKEIQREWGRKWISDGDEIHLDQKLRIKPEPKELWVMAYNNKTASPCFSSSYKTEENATSYMQTLQKDNPVMFDDAYVTKVMEVIK